MHTRRMLGTTALVVADFFFRLSFPDCFLLAFADCFVIPSSFVIRISSFHVGSWRECTRPSDDN